MILQRTLAALAAVGVFGASAGCMYAFADELPDNTEQLPDRVYATAGDESSADGAVIYSMDSSNYTDGYNVDFKAEKDSLMSVDRLTINGRVYQSGAPTLVNRIPLFGVGDKRDDGYYITLDYTDDLGSKGQIEVGPLDAPLYGFDGVSDQLIISDSGVVLKRNFLCFGADSGFYLLDDTIGGAPEGLSYSKVWSKGHIFNISSYSVDMTCFYSDSFSAGFRYGINLPYKSWVSYTGKPPYLGVSYPDDLADEYKRDFTILLCRSSAVTTNLDASRFLHGTFPSNVQSLQISCSGDVFADVSNRPSAIPSVTSEDGLPAVFSATGKYVDFVTSNPVTAVCFSSTLVPIGIAVWRCLRGVV